MGTPFHIREGQKHTTSKDGGHPAIFHFTNVYTKIYTSTIS
jgi:hypothetical protein